MYSTLHEVTNHHVACTMELDHLDMMITGDLLSIIIHDEYVS